MARCEFATWDPDGATPGGAIDPRVAILHCTAVDFDAHPHDGLEWHFEIDFDGNIWQLVDTEQSAAANYKANAFAVSIETWGTGDKAWTPAQIEAIIKLLRWLNKTHPKIRLVRCDGPYGSGLGYHTMWGAPSPWTPVAKSCPGEKRKQQFEQIILPRLAAPETSQEDDPMVPIIRHVIETYRERVRRQVDRAGLNFWASQFHARKDDPMGTLAVHYALDDALALEAAGLGPDPHGAVDMAAITAAVDGLLAKHLAALKVDVDEGAIAAAVLAGMPPAQVAAAIDAAGLAEAVADELRERLTA